MNDTKSVEFVAYLATSLDGFIAREDGGLDWLDCYQGGEEDYGFYEFIGSVDRLVMGRKTFDMVMEFGEWPYGDLPVVVLSHNVVSIPEDLQGKVSCFSGSLEALGEKLGEEGATKVYVDGGQTIRSFLEANLLAELTLTLVPIILGKGIPLFDQNTAERKLKLISSKSYESGLTQVQYQIG